MAEDEVEDADVSPYFEGEAEGARERLLDLLESSGARLPEPHPDFSKP